jgi:hypothetical protein
VGDLRLIASLFSPLFLGLILHGFCIRFGWLAGLARPVDRGSVFRGRRLFGPNKTYRGLVAVGSGTALGYTLQGLWPELQPPSLRHLPLVHLALFGLALGIASMLSELPNSFLKRQLGIAAGAPGRGVAAPLFYLLDQVDFLFGAWLVACPWVSPTWTRVLASVVFVLLVHQVLSILGALLGMRASAR